MALYAAWTCEARRRTGAHAATGARGWSGARPGGPDPLCLARCRVLPGGVTGPAAAGWRTVEPLPMGRAVDMGQVGAHCTSDHRHDYGSAAQVKCQRRCVPYSPWRSSPLCCGPGAPGTMRVGRCPTAALAARHGAKPAARTGSGLAQWHRVAVSGAGLWRPGGLALQTLGEAEPCRLATAGREGGTSLKHPCRVPTDGGTSRTTLA